MCSHGNGRSQLLSAIEANDLEEVERIISEGVQPGNEKTVANQDQAIHVSCIRRNSLELIDLLINNGANVESRGVGGQTPLLKAASAGIVENVEYLLDVRHANVKSRDDNKKTALHMAATSRCRAIVDILCKHGAFINAQDKNGVTPLCCAASLGADKVVSLLVSMQCNTNMMDKNGNGPLHHACQHGHENIVKLLAENADTKIDAKNADGCTPLFLAASLDNDKVVDVLLEHGADVNIVNSRGKTSLVEAIIQKSDKLALKLAKLQQDVNVTDDSGMTALHHCILKDLFEPFELLLQRKAKIYIKSEKHGTPLNFAAASKETYRYLIRLLTCSQGLFYKYHRSEAIEGIDEFKFPMQVNLSIRTLGEDGVEEKVGKKEFDFSDESLMTVMMAYWGNKQAAAMCLERSTERVSAANEINTYKFLYYLFHISTKEGDIYRIKKFLESGGDMEFHASPFSTLLLTAVAWQNHGMVKLLYNYGANIRATGLSGKSAMHYACENLNVPMVKLLLNYGFDPDMKNDEQGGATPLVTALSTSSSLSKQKLRQFKQKIVKMLLDAGADPNVMVENELNFLHPLACAILSPCKNELPGAVRFLLRAGAKPNVGVYSKNTNTWYSPHELTEMYGHSKSRAELLKAGVDPKLILPGIRNRKLLSEKKNVMGDSQMRAAVRQCIKSIEEKDDENRRKTTLT